MTSRGIFPKTDGDIYYAGDANIEHAPYNDSLEKTMSITTTSSTLDISSLTTCSSIVIENIGGTTAFFRFAATAATSDFPIRAGEKIDFKNVSFDRIDAITAASTTELIVIAKEDPTYEGALDSYELLSISATDASSNDTFTASDYKDILIANTGSNEVYILFGATATTSDLKLETGQTIYLGHTNQSQIAAICNAAETTTVKILGVY